MEDSSENVAVMVEEARPREADDVRAKRQPPYAVVVLNDALHTFDYVIETFQKVFGYSVEKGAQLALQIHRDGRGIVWSGTRELAELKVEQIKGAGPDLYAQVRVDFPLGSFVEPLPQ